MGTHETCPRPYEYPQHRFFIEEKIVPELITKYSSFTRPQVWDSISDTWQPCKSSQVWNWRLNLKRPSKICSRWQSYLFIIFGENKSWHEMWIVCQADDLKKIWRLIIIIIISFFFLIKKKNRLIGLSRSLFMVNGKCTKISYTKVSDKIAYANSADPV